MQPAELVLVLNAVGTFLVGTYLVYHAVSTGKYKKYSDNGVNPFDYLFSPMPEGTFSARQPFFEAYAISGGYLLLVGFGWIIANVPEWFGMAIFYLCIAIVVMAVSLIERISPEGADATSAVLFGYGEWEDQFLWGALIGGVFIILNFLNPPMQVVGLQIEGMALASFILSVYMIPIAEEVIFRGVFTTTLMENLGLVPGVLIGGAVFAAYHAFAYSYNLTPIIYAFIFGVMTGLTTARFKSVLPGIVAHAIVNFLAYLNWLG